MWWIDILFIDRPATNDTRQAFENYAVFKQAPFVAAANAVKLTDDTTAAVIPKLGTNGISYAISDRVTNIPGVRIVPMHKTLPSDPRYPFSQSLAYVYKEPTPNPAAAAFLGLAAATAIGSQAAVPATPAAVAPSSQTTEVASTQDTADTGFPWWLLLIPLLGGLLWWLLT